MKKTTTKKMKKTKTKTKTKKKVHRTVTQKEVTRSPKPWKKTTMVTARTAAVRTTRTARATRAVIQVVKVMKVMKKHNLLLQRKKRGQSFHGCSPSPRPLQPTNVRRQTSVTFPTAKTSGGCITSNTNITSTNPNTGTRKTPLSAAMERSTRRPFGLRRKALFKSFDPFRNRNSLKYPWVSTFKKEKRKNANVPNSSPRMKPWPLVKENE